MGCGSSNSSNTADLNLNEPVEAAQHAKRKQIGRPQLDIPELNRRRLEAERPTEMTVLDEDDDVTLENGGQCEAPRQNGGLPQPAELYPSLTPFKKSPTPPLVPPPELPEELVTRVSRPGSRGSHRSSRSHRSVISSLVVEPPVQEDHQLCEEEVLQNELAAEERN